MRTSLACLVNATVQSDGGGGKVAGNGCRPRAWKVTTSARRSRLASTARKLATRTRSSQSFTRLLGSSRPEVRVSVWTFSATCCSKARAGTQPAPVRRRRGDPVRSAGPASRRGDPRSPHSDTVKSSPRSTSWASAPLSTKRSGAATTRLASRRCSKACRNAAAVSSLTRAARLEEPVVPTVPPGGSVPREQPTPATWWPGPS